jgi:hypothetical protein
LRLGNDLLAKTCEFDVRQVFGRRRGVLLRRLAAFAARIDL